MVELLDRVKVGPYILTKRLASSDLGERWLALHELDNSSHVLHRLKGDGLDADTFLSAARAGQGLDHAHILRIEAFGLDGRDCPWVVTAYAGDRNGIVALDRFVRQKGGQLDVDEAHLGIVQLLEALEYAHARPVLHGPITMPDIQVDRRGSLAIELFGLRRALGLFAARVKTEAHDEVRDVIGIGYQLMTGLVPEAPVIPASRVVMKLDPSWDEWFARGLGPGFPTAGRALAALADRRPHVEPKWPMGAVGRMGAMLSRLVGSK